MGHIIMPAFAFRSALSEDSGVRAGFALSEADMLGHLPADHHLRERLISDEVLRLGSEDYAEAVGDLLFALGATAEPGMLTLGMRMMALLKRDWRSLLRLDEMMAIEAVASHYLRLRNQNDIEQAAIFAELKAMVDDKAGVLEALVEAMTQHLAFNPHFTRDVANADLVALSALFASERLPADGAQYFDQRFIN